MERWNNGCNSHLHLSRPMIVTSFHFGWQICRALYVFGIGSRIFLHFVNRLLTADESEKRVLLTKETGSEKNQLSEPKRVEQVRASYSALRICHPKWNELTIFVDLAVIIGNYYSMNDTSHLIIPRLILEKWTRMLYICIMIIHNRFMKM